MSTEPHICMGCGRIMSNREAAEQGGCNDCFGPYRLVGDDFSDDFDREPYDPYEDL